jgi:hypothetical protein
MTVQMFAALNLALFAYQLKPMQAAPVERDADPTKPCIVFFSEPEKRVALLLSASQTLPENAFIVPQPDWITVVEQAEETALYLLQGITMNEFGQCFHVKFKTPQKITFLCNFVPESKFSFSQVTGRQHAQQFQDYERQRTHCPMSSGIELNEYTDDKLHTRLLAAAKQIQVPTTLAFSCALAKYQHHPVSSQVQLIDRSSHLSVAAIRTYLSDFPCDRFVIKPSGARWMGGRACTLESKEHLDLAVANFQQCLGLLSQDECLLVEEFIDSRLSDRSSLGARLRIFVTRRPSNGVETSGILCHLGDVTQPIGGDTSESFSIDYLFQCLRLTPNQKTRLIDRLHQLGETVLAAIIDYETLYLTAIPPHQQTDFIGLDVFLKHQQGKLVPFLVEVNNHDCISTLQLYEVQHAPHRTGILDKWVETMVYRSYQYMLKDQTLLILGGGDGEDLQAIEWANAFGLNLIWGGSEPQPAPLSGCPPCLEIDIENARTDLETALAILKQVRHQQLTVNGVIPLEHKYWTVATLVAVLMGNSANRYESVSLAQSQLFMQQKILMDEVKKLTFEARKFAYGVAVVAINSLQDIQRIPVQDYPVVIALTPEIPDFGPAIVATPAQLLARFEAVQTLLPAGIRFGLNCQLMATAYPHGIPQNVVLILSEGELVAGYPTPPGFTRHPWTPEKPDILLDQERQENLIYAAWRVCHTLGLHNGIFYVEGVSTELGAKILAIQVCPWQPDLIQWLFQEWDIHPVLYSALIACGLKPFVNQHRQPRRHLLREVRETRWGWEG